MGGYFSHLVQTHSHQLPLWTGHAEGTARGSGVGTLERLVAVQGAASRCLGREGRGRQRGGQLTTGHTQIGAALSPHTVAV